MRGREDLGVPSSASHASHVPGPRAGDSLSTSQSKAPEALGLALLLPKLYPHPQLATVHLSGIFGLGPFRGLCPFNNILSVSALYQALMLCLGDTVMNSFIYRNVSNNMFSSPKTHIWVAFHSPIILG